MADRPIIFSGPMVRALLASTKTQTGRVLKPQPPTPEQFPGSGFALDRRVADGVKAYSLNDLDQLPKHPTKWDLCGSVGVARDAGLPTIYDVRFGAGDRLWVREVWRATSDWNDQAPSKIQPGYIRYEADPCVAHSYGKLRQSIFMPRWASRLTLTVSEVRVERLQDINEADARAEGWPHADADPTRIPSGAKTARGWFRMLWCDLHGPDAWAANPWVAAITFSTTPANIDSLPEQP